MTKGRTKAKMENTLVFYHAEEQVEGALARAEPEEDTGHTQNAPSLAGKERRASPGGQTPVAAD